MVKETEYYDVLSARQVTQNFQAVDDEADFSAITNVLEDRDDSCLEDQEFFTLKGPKFSYRLKVSIARMLFPHQQEGLRWLWSLHCQGKGGILGDDMGLGKTMQICGFLAGLFQSSLIKRVLVVAPKTLVRHWIKELSTVGLSRMTRDYSGASTKTRESQLHYVLQDKGVLLTTYDIVRCNSESLMGDRCHGGDDEEIMWDYMILDEELWALFNFCCPGLLGDKKGFQEKFENPILLGNDKYASERDKCIGSTAAKELRQCIQPYFLRRVKNDTNAVTLPKKNEIIVWLRLTTSQRQSYEAFLNSDLVLSAFHGSPLTALRILKNICDHPLTLTKRAAEDDLDEIEKLAIHISDVSEKEELQEQHDNLSCKIAFILSLLDNLITEGHKIVIFSQTRKMLNFIQESLLSSGYEFARIDGTTTASDRVKIVDDFQEHDVAPIFLSTSKVGGLGLTLTTADRVIVVDPAWNPSTDNQSVDRAYRIGQKKDVIVYRLMTCGTVEEKIYRKQIFKGGLFKTATEPEEQIQYFSQEDLRDLFSLPKLGFDVSVTQQQLYEEHGQQLNMDESLDCHIKFLETLGIAGVSHHSLLFFKTAPEPEVAAPEPEVAAPEPEVAAPEPEVATPEPEVADSKIRNSRTTYAGNSSSSASEHDVNGYQYAFSPKDVEPGTQSFANKETTADKLADKVAKLQKRIADVNLKLNEIIQQNLDKKRKQESRVPAPIVACVPKNGHADGVGETEFEVSSSEILDDIKSAMVEPIEAEPELEVPQELITPSQLDELKLQRRPLFVPPSQESNVTKVYDKETGITQCRLSNGISINYKISKNEAQEGVMRLIVGGGRAAESYDSRGAVGVGVRTLGEGGRVGNFSREQVELFCVNHLINWYLEPAEEFIAMEFRFTLRDNGMRAAFQLLHMVLEHSVWLEDAFDRARQLYLSYYRYIPKSLERSTVHKLMLAMLNGDERFVEPTPKSLQNLSLKTVKDAVMNQFTGNNMEVSIVGDFSEEEIESCILDYLGTVRATRDSNGSSESNPIVFQLSPSDLQHQQVFLKDTEERACAYIAGPAPNRWGFTFDDKDLFESLNDISTTIDVQPKSEQLIGEEVIEEDQQQKLRSHPLFFGITMGLLAEIINSSIFYISVSQCLSSTASARVGVADCFLFRLFTTVQDSLVVSFELKLFDRINLGWYMIYVTSTPGKVHKAVDACKNVLRGLYSDRVVPRELDMAKQTLLMRHEAKIKSNDYWLGLLAHLQASSVQRKDISCIKDLTVLYEAATIDDIYLAYQQLKVDENSLYSCVGLAGTQAGEEDAVV